MSSPLIDTITTAIAALTITEGAVTLNILDMGETPTAIDERTCPVMFSDPEAIINNFVTTRDTMGAAGAAGYSFGYDLNYYLAYAPVGSQRSIGDIMPTLIDWARAFVAGIVAADDTIGNVDIFPSVGVIGTVIDPLGNAFYGLRVTISIKEYR